MYVIFSKTTSGYNRITEWMTFEEAFKILNSDCTQNLEIFAKGVV